MKKQILPAITAGALALACASCSMDSPWTGNAGEGAISLDFSASGSLERAVPKVRADFQSIRVPESKDFSVTLSRIDGTYSKTWASVDDFRKEASFKVGAYTLAVAYGNEKSQGYDSPWFHGETTLNVSEGETAKASVSATLKNAVVEVEYTEAFKKYFQSYETTLQSAGHDYLALDRDGDYIFIVPGKVDVTIQVTTPQGKTARLTPASFQVSAGCYHKVKYNVNNGEIGQLDRIEVTFSDDVDEEPVIIDLTDELYTSEPPQLTPQGFANGDVVESLEGTPMEGSFKIDALCAGEFASAKLTVESNSFTPLWGNEIDLIAASASEQAQIEKAGIKVLGLFRNPDRMAVVDLSGFAKTLPVGRHTISFSVTDKLSRATEPVSVTFDSQALDLQASSEADIKFGSSEATVRVAYNGPNPGEAFTFRANDANGVFHDARVISFEEVSATRSFVTKYYDFTIAVPQANRNDVKIQVYYFGSKKQDLTATVEVPAYTIIADAHAHKAVLKVVPEAGSENLTEAICSLLKVYVDGGKYPGSSMERDNANGYITLNDLKAGTQYTVNTTIRDIAGATDPSADENGVFSAPVTFQTEVERTIPNGDFSDIAETVNRSKVETGGRYKYTVQYQATATVKASEPTSWASINEKTCWWGSSVINTWFQVPSTYAENGAVVLRNVGFDHNGTKPKDSSSNCWYNPNVPAFGSGKQAAGELFLGSYSFDGTEHRNDGIDFESRPVSMQFDYKYQPDGNDKAFAYIRILDASGNIISQNTVVLAAAANMTGKTVQLPAYTFGAKAKKIQIGFKSSNADLPPITVPTGSALSMGFGAGNFGNKAIGENYPAKATGSVLTVDNVKLNF